MKKSFIFCIVLLTGIVLFFPRISYAHFFKTDKQITVELHVDPNDHPIPEQQANLYFFVSDKAKRFQLAQCDCTVIVTEQGKQIYHKPLLASTEKDDGILGAKAPFIFPKKDVYTITLQGKPVTQNAFQAFNISWNFRVDQSPQIYNSSQKQSDPTFIYYVIGFLCIFLIVGVCLFLALRF